MSVASVDFYASLVPFKRFSDLTNPKHYKQVPDDWWIIITDVKGSTQALENDRYKDVNLLGASSIIAVMNTLKGQEVPFVFGGDGATLLVHSRDIEKVKPGLVGTQRLARDVLNFELRIGLVPVRAIAEKGFKIEVAKFAISDKTNIATLRGGGLAQAEKMVKSEADAFNPYRIEIDSGIEADLTSFQGLSCRWNPIKAKRGEIMSLLVVATELETSEATYRRVIQAIDDIMKGNSGHPASPEKMTEGQNYAALWKEMRMHTMGQPLLAKFKRMRRIVFETFVLTLFMITGYKNDRFSAEIYIRELGENTDFQKFDDMVRMVRDCTLPQRDQIIEMLKKERAAGQIAYGVHMSNEALLTCLVFQLDNHIHFVDGGSGGYAIAAKQLKEQLRQSSATA